jgi:hypothetical protein
VFACVAIALGGAAGGCRIRSKDPYWIEAHGRAEALRLSAWPAGALAIGTDHRLYGYPGPWGRSWYPQGHPAELRTIAASNVAVYAIFNDGQVARFAADRWAPVPASAAWGATELGATQDDRLIVVAGGKVQIFDGASLRDAPSCASAVPAVAVAGTRGDEAFVLDQEGGLHHLAGDVCTTLDTPTRLQRIAANAGRLLAVGADGTVWRWRDARWTALPAPFKYRAGRRAFPTQARDVSASAYSSWLLDDAGAIFVLSDES